MNQIVSDFVDDLKAASRNIAFSLALYSGQICIARAVELTGAIQNEGIAQAHRRSPKIRQCAARWPIAHAPAFAEARVLSPLILKLDARTGESQFTKEWFGPISFVIATDSTSQLRDLAGSIAQTHGALPFSVYSPNNAVIDDAAQEATIRGGVAAVDQSDRRRVRQSDRGVLGLSRHERESRRQRRAVRRRIREKRTPRFEGL